MEIKDIDLYSAAYNQPFFIASGSEHFELPTVERKSFSEYFDEARDNQSSIAANRFTESGSSIAENAFQSVRQTSFYQEKTIENNDDAANNRSIDENSLQKESSTAEKDAGAAQESEAQNNADDEIEEQTSSKKETDNQPNNDTDSNTSVGNQENPVSSTDENIPVTDQTLDSSEITAANAQQIEQTQSSKIPNETLLADKEQESIEKNADLQNQAGKDVQHKPEPLLNPVSEQSLLGKASLEGESQPVQSSETAVHANMTKSHLVDETKKDAKQDNPAQTNVQNYADIVQNNSSLSNNSENYQENSGFLGQKTPDSALNIQNSENDETSFKTSLDNLKNEMNVSLDNIRSAGGAEKAAAQSVDKEINMPRYSDIRFDEKELLQHIQSKIQMRNFDGMRHSEMSFRLNPDSLGSLSLKLVMDNETLTAKIKVDNSNVRQIIEGNLIELRKSLQTQGVKVEKVEVSLRNDMEQPSYSSQGETGNGHIKQRSKQLVNRFSTRNSEVEETSGQDGMSNIKQRFHDGQLDYLI